MTGLCSPAQSPSLPGTGLRRQRPGATNRSARREDAEAGQGGVRPARARIRALPALPGAGRGDARADAGGQEDAGGRAPRRARIRALPALPDAGPAGARRVAVGEALLAAAARAGRRLSRPAARPGAGATVVGSQPGVSSRERGNMLRRSLETGNGRRARSGPGSPTIHTRGLGSGCGAFPRLSHRTEFRPSDRTPSGAAAWADHTGPRRAPAAPSPTRSPGMANTAADPAGPLGAPALRDGCRPGPEWGRRRRGVAQGLRRRSCKLRPGNVGVITCNAKMKSSHLIR